MNTLKNNLLLLVKLPSAFFCGVRIKYYDKTKAVVKVKHRWINQNPFQSLYFAVQAMAAELSTGVLVKNNIDINNLNVSMLVVQNKSSFYKKAKGTIHFTCEEGFKIETLIKKLTIENPAATVWIKSIGINELGETVSEFEFEWSLKLKNISK